MKAELHLFREYADGVQLFASRRAPINPTPMVGDLVGFVNPIPLRVVSRTWDTFPPDKRPRLRIDCEPTEDMDATMGYHAFVNYLRTEGWTVVDDEAADGVGC